MPAMVVMVVSLIKMGLWNLNFFSKIYEHSMETAGQTKRKYCIIIRDEAKPKHKKKKKNLGCN